MLVFSFYIVNLTNSIISCLLHTSLLSPFFVRLSFLLVSYSNFLFSLCLYFLFSLTFSSSPLFVQVFFCLHLLFVFISFYSSTFSSPSFFVYFSLLSQLPLLSFTLFSFYAFSFPLIFSYSLLFISYLYLLPLPYSCSFF